MEIDVDAKAAMRWAMYELSLKTMKPLVFPATLDTTVRF